MLDLLPSFLAAADTTFAADANAADKIAGQFGVNWPFFIAQVINFIVVAIILWKLAFKPVIKTLEDRKQKISDGLQFAEEMKVRLAETEKQAAQKLREASEEAATIVKEARENASAYTEKQAQDAVHKAEQIVAKAKEAMELEHKQMMIEVRQEVAKLVVLTSAKVLDKELSADDKARFTETASKEIYANN